MKRLYFYIIIMYILLIIISCQTSVNNISNSSLEDKSINFNDLRNWEKYPDNPVLRDPYLGYESASDPHVFFDENGDLWMIYSGDNEDHSSIKLAKGNSFTDWEIVDTLLSGKDTPGFDEFAGKETSFYRYSSERNKHQIYYIAYYKEEYNAEIYLAESDNLEGPYTMSEEPIIPLGYIAGNDVKVITSPSIVEHEEVLYITFIGWNDSPDKVSEVWILGAVSNDDGLTWTDFQEVETPIGMEGQVTKGIDGYYYVVNTGDYNGDEAIYLSRAEHPFGPYESINEPILTKSDTELEKDEIIAPQITFDNENNVAYLYYTGAVHLKGWWVMLAYTDYTIE